MPPVVTAVELAGRLRVDPKVFRGWLRRQAAAGHELLRTHQHQASWTFTEDEAGQLAVEYRRNKVGPSAPVSRAKAVPSVASREELSGADRSRAPEAAGADGSILRGHQVRMDWLGSTVTTLADLLRPGLKAVTVGINPAPVSVAAGHYYQGSAGQTFYRRLTVVGLLPPGGGSRTIARSRPASASQTSSSGPRGTPTRSRRTSWSSAAASSRTSYGRWMYPW